MWHWKENEHFLHILGKVLEFVHTVIFVNKLNILKTYKTFKLTSFLCPIASKKFLNFLNFSIFQIYLEFMKRQLCLHMRWSSTVYVITDQYSTGYSQFKSYLSVSCSPLGPWLSSYHQMCQSTILPYRPMLHFHYPIRKMSSSKVKVEFWRNWVTIVCGTFRLHSYV